MEQTDPNAAHKIREDDTHIYYDATLCDCHGVSFGSVCIPCQELAQRRGRMTEAQWYGTWISKKK